MPDFDLLILSNAPGEISTWVYPVWAELQRQNLRVRVSVILSPCPHANGTEAEIISSWGVDRVLAPTNFWRFLLWGKTPNWDWHERGAVLFLGGDQLYPVLIGKRLNYKILIYAEWTARWLRFIDFVLARNPSVKVPHRFQAKLQVIGDLMLCRSSAHGNELPISFAHDRPLVVLMPGSKHNKLILGVPLFLGTANELSLANPHLQFAIPLAPTITAEKLITYAPEGFYLRDDRQDQIVMPSGQVVHLYSPFPAQDLLAQAVLCLTTVGANTAELASLGVPMLVVLPTGKSQIATPVAWDGILGLINSNPWVSRLINEYMVKQIRKRGQKLAWPNIWAGEEIVPELWGDLTPISLARETLSYLERPAELAKMHDRLLAVAGANSDGNAAQRIISLIQHLQEQAPT
jgi:lipid-A-disaccharide synthase